MNFLSKNMETNDFYLIGISMMPDGDFSVDAVYLHDDGSIRVNGESSMFSNKWDAVKKCERLQRTKRRMKKYFPVDLSLLPKEGIQYLKADVDRYIPAAEMLQMIEDAMREFYIEFDCVVGMAASFDEGVEYIAIQDKKDEEYYHVYDRNGQQRICHKLRFSRLEQTERGLLVGDHDNEYSCAYCKDSVYGCAHCTS